MKIQLTQQQQSIGRHLLFWAGIVLLYYSIEVSRGKPDQFWFVLVRSLPGDMIVTYFTYYVIVERFLLKRRYWQAAVLLLLSAAIFSTLVWTVLYYTIVPRVFPDGAMRPWLNGPAIIQIGIGLYYVAFMFSGLKLYRMWKKNREQQQEMEQQQLRSELALLRAQVNPHFLFNTLNNIDTLVFEDQQKASASIVKLSQIMRYMLYDAGAELVPVSKEIECLNNLIELQRLRLREPEFIRFRVRGDTAGKHIPPMLLLPFIENTFKHGSLQGPSPGIVIDLCIEPEVYRLEVSNRCKPRAEIWEQTSGLGLQNVRRRLQLIYGRDTKLEVRHDPDYFYVKLEIPATHAPQGQELEETSKSDPFTDALPAVRTMPAAAGPADTSHPYEN